MLLIVKISHQPASDIGYLWHKNPARAQSFNLPFGTARVWYPKLTDDVCIFALWLEIDPVRLSRGERGRDWGLEPYVNDRPYVASSFLCVAIAQVLRDALNGQSKERGELAQTALPLEIHLPVVPSHGGRELLERLFAPLGYEVEAKPLDETVGRYFALTLRGNLTLSEALTHLYVLLPVTDSAKHYWIGEDEVEKLLRRGGAWLAKHPEREMIAFRYLNRRRALVNEAVARLMSLDESADATETAPLEAEEAVVATEETPERIGLHAQRLSGALHELKTSGAKSVLDLGCGEGRLLQLLLKESQFARICGLDASHRALEVAARRLKLERLSENQRDKIHLWHGALTYRDARWNGFDAAAVVEVIEHLDAARLQAFEKSLWGHARPKTVVLTTPNREYNVLWESLPAGKMRHGDHRFEWTRQEFETWANQIAARYDYAVRFAPVGPLDETHGAPSQMAVWTREG